MKKLVFLFVAVVASYAAQAQSTFGIKGGLNYSNLSGDLKDESRFNNKLGFNAGVYFNAPIVGDFFSIQPEVLYSNKGFKYDDKVENTLLQGQYRYEGTANFNYIDVPVLAKVKAGSFFFEAGPQVSYLMSVNDKTKQYDSKGTLVDRTVSEKSKEGYSDFEIGYAAGLGFATQSGISLGLRYNGAFTDLGEDASANSVQGDFKDARHSLFQLSVGFPISR
ncbi:porin family protein [Rufibacter glacialis]|uniref:PorT family protein n=1 Tax=Rufibacter glacialis TaxID=1259555 RepID=A0A5M8Q7S3_9BACT|nr:porin family protein [Rufibacter glacialis]KAA6431178.1 PorT family protein [Rufibacter glacialis]GGK84716.1 membrane protein [Rufibacter glacialis]